MAYLEVLLYVFLVKYNFHLETLTNKNFEDFCTNKFGIPGFLLKGRKKYAVETEGGSFLAIT